MAEPKLPRILSRKSVPLADACVTEWRKKHGQALWQQNPCHSLMPVLLNGGCGADGGQGAGAEVPLADACATEWRVKNDTKNSQSIHSATR